MKKVMMLLGVLFLLAAPGMAQNVEIDDAGVQNIIKKAVDRKISVARSAAQEKMHAQINDADIKITFGNYILIGKCQYFYETYDRKYTANGELIAYKTDINEGFALYTTLFRIESGNLTLVHKTREFKDYGDSFPCMTAPELVKQAKDWAGKDPITVTRSAAYDTEAKDLISKMHNNAPDSEEFQKALKRFSSHKVDARIQNYCKKTYSVAWVGGVEDPKIEICCTAVKEADAGVPWGEYFKSAKKVVYRPDGGRFPNIPWQRKYHHADDAEELVDLCINYSKSKNAVFLYLDEWDIGDTIRESW